MNHLNLFLTKEIQDFINENINSNISDLALQKHNFKTIGYSQIINQIVAKQKAKDKLPTWFTTEHIIYPPKVSIEQTSSERAAKYKSSIIEGENLIDLSGGFGIDDYYFSSVFKNVIHCEINEELSSIVSHNYKQLKKENIKCIAGESAEILKKLNSQFDCIYIDPSRRNDKKGKVFLLQDCEPNVPDLLSFYYNYTNRILIKTAPILDIQAGLNELHNVKNIHIVAVDNEVKELLWEIEKDYTNDVTLISVNLEKENDSIVKTILGKEYSPTFSLPETYLYEPNASLLKSGNFNAISEIFQFNKLHQHSHLYTSNNKIDFPGRRFKINSIIPFQKKEIKGIINSKMNVTTRNFPLKVDEIKKKYKIKDGGTVFAFFTTNIENNKIVLLCSKV
ncbi:MULTISPECIES: THUMP-like domain-containing protein [Flavobacterium]|uniref:Class I SAM-dependent methyltransferase n=1 Tax=Flavobacterium jumunjinense TaxID=998845 RepID=A0ABV5GT25_9FLAO|nr:MULTISPECIES: class I SAM-dependent methyltransferase [Flavobacterium]